MTIENNYWHCTNCHQKVYPDEATFQETHSISDGGCGGDLIPVDDNNISLMVQGCSVLVKENQILREALEFYKNEDNYKFQPIRHEYDHSIEYSDSCPIYEDNGKIAKKALEAKCE